MNVLDLHIIVVFFTKKYLKKYTYKIVSLHNYFDFITTDLDTSKTYWPRVYQFSTIL